MSLFGLFSKKEPGKEEPQEQQLGVSDWYQDRYQQLIAQRNLFFVLSALCLIFIVIDIVIIGTIVSKKKIEPLVVQVDEVSGITSLVNPLKDKSWSVSKTINNYFLLSYLRARETYNPASYLYNYNTIVRLFSAGNVYREFKDLINDPNSSPALRYGANNSTRLEIRSILMLKSGPGGGQNAQIRFSLVEEQGAKRRINKIASIIWDYVEMDLNFDEKSVNPLGFQVQFYTASYDANV